VAGVASLTCVALTYAEIVVLRSVVAEPTTAPGAAHLPQLAHIGGPEFRAREVSVAEVAVMAASAVMLPLPSACRGEPDVETRRALTRRRGALRYG